MPKCCSSSSSNFAAEMCRRASDSTRRCCSIPANSSGLCNCCSFFFQLLGDIIQLFILLSDVITHYQTLLLYYAYTFQCRWWVDIIIKVNNMINLIDQRGKFNQALREYPNSSANIAIFGSQSSGKSTLMNSAFSTQFPVLNTKEDRRRCTRGVWLQHIGKYNIIDTEGFDSVERGTSERIFERQIALFCLAVADVIMVNLWMNEIGRYQGGQLHILKAIIHAANHLVQAQAKTLIFVVKDCSRDANHAVLKGEIQDQISRIIAECPAKGPKCLKFNIDYYFMSHYIYQPEQYEKQAKKLPTLIHIRNPSLNLHEPKDRVIYMQHLWETIIANDGQIDLRIEEEGIRNYVVNRIRNQVRDAIVGLIVQETRISKRNSYQRFYEYYVKKSFEEIKSKLPKYVDQKTIKQQFFLLEESLEYEIQKHFSEVILPNQQHYLLTECLQKQLQKAYNSIQLQKIITQQRKKVLQLYKLLVQGHKEAPILVKRFAERITEESVNFERQVSHLFNIFQTKLQNQINKQLDKQVRRLKFDGDKVTQKFKTLCKQFQYNEWQVNTKQIWQKASHRALTQRLAQKIDDFSGIQAYSMLASDKETQIITQHKQLVKNIEEFINSLLQYFQQEDTGQQYLQKAKQKVYLSLEKALIQEKKRFRLSMLILGIFLIFCYGQFMLLLKATGLKKKTRNNLSTFYITCAVVLVVGSLAKRMLGKLSNSGRLQS